MNDDEDERLDQEFEELLSELRVLIPGVTVLLGFLLTVPFTAAGSRPGGFNRAVYFISFVSIALAAVLLIAPSTQHRVLWRRGQKSRLLPTGNRLALTATAFLAVGLAAVVFLVTEVLYGTSWAVGVTIGLTLVLAWCWYGLAFVREREPPRESRSEAS